MSFTFWFMQATYKFPTVQEKGSNEIIVLADVEPTSSPSADNGKMAALEDPDDSYSTLEDHKRRCWYFAMVCQYSTFLRGI